MVAGFTFWQLPDEEKAFLDFVDGTGTIVAIAQGPVDSDKELLLRPFREYIDTHDPTLLFFGPREHVLLAVVEPLGHGETKQLFITHHTSCLLRYERGGFRGESGELSPFALSGYWQRLNDNKTGYLNKDPAFKKWGEKVLRWMRTRTVKNDQPMGNRITAHAKEAIGKGTLRIVW